jgi:membrane fusion protein (multidrug efflux system)
MAPDDHGRAAALPRNEQISPARADTRSDADRSENGISETHKKRRRKRSEKPTLFQKPAFKIGAIAAAMVFVVGGIIWWWIARQYEKTDDAFIDTHIVMISPQVSGQVTRVYVTDNQQVAAGDPLVEIDSAEARTRLEQARAQEAQAKTQYEQAIAALKGAQAKVESAESEIGRYRSLQRIMPAAVAQQQIDQATAAAKNAAAERDAAQAQIAGASALINVYKAQIAAAQLTLGYTHITAPMAGHVAQRTVAIGNYVSPGQALMSIVPLQLWVTANYKETQLTRMRVGQPARIVIDACGGAEAKGHVDSIQRGAGQAFGILPPENATGNFVKVVQRVPVKIVLDKLPGDTCVLGPGMSVEPRVTVR